LFLGFIWRISEKKQATAICRVCHSPHGGSQCTGVAAGCARCRDASHSLASCTAAPPLEEKCTICSSSHLWPRCPQLRKTEIATLASLRVMSIFRPAGAPAAPIPPPNAGMPLLAPPGGSAMIAPPPGLSLPAWSPAVPNSWFGTMWHHVQALYSKCTDQQTQLVQLRQQVTLHEAELARLRNVVPSLPVGASFFPARSVAVVVLVVAASAPMVAVSALVIADPKTLVTPSTASPDQTLDRKHSGSQVNVSSTCSGDSPAHKTTTTGSSSAGKPVATPVRASGSRFKGLPLVQQTPRTPSVTAASSTTPLGKRTRMAAVISPDGRADNLD